MRIETPPPSGIDGVNLRQIERHDADQWFAYLCLAEVYEHTSWNVQSPADLAPLFESFEASGAATARRLAIIDTTANRLAGTIGFHTVSVDNRSAEIAYDLAPAYWGRGIASRLCEAVTCWSYGAFGFHRVQATVLVSNQRSERVLRRCHYRHEGILRAFRMVRGRPGDFNCFSRLATDRST